MRNLVEVEVEVEELQHQQHQSHQRVLTSTEPDMIWSLGYDLAHAEPCTFCKWQRFGPLLSHLNQYSPLTCTFWDPSAHGGGNYRIGRYRMMCVCVCACVRVCVCVCVCLCAINVL